MSQIKFLELAQQYINMGELQGKLSFWASQWEMYQEGIRDVRMHDWTLSVLSM